MSIAVFLDVENLLGGYAPPKATGAVDIVTKYLDKLDSLVAEEAEIAIRRAYANWRHPGLADLQIELLRRGYVAENVLMLNGQIAKNLLDIQLAVDVTELLLTRQGITHFIIASGDGGFASLGRKLREHLKTVWFIGRKGSCASILSSFSNRVIALDVPILEMPSTGLTAARPPALPPTKAKVSPQSLLSEQESLRDRWRAFQGKVVPVAVASPEEAVAVVRAGLESLLADPVIARMLHSESLSLGNVVELPRLLIRDFTLATTGKKDMRSLMAAALRGTGAEIRMKKGGKVILAPRVVPTAKKVQGLCENAGTIESKPGTAATLVVSSPVGLPAEQVPKVTSLPVYLDLACEVLAELCASASGEKSVLFDMSQYGQRIREATGHARPEDFGFAKLAQVAATAACGFGCQVGRILSSGQKYVLTPVGEDLEDVAWVAPCLEDDLHSEISYRRILECARPPLPPPAPEVFEELAPHLGQSDFVLASSAGLLDREIPSPAVSWLKRMVATGEVEMQGHRCRLKGSTTLEDLLRRVRHEAVTLISQRLGDLNLGLLDAIMPDLTGPSEVT